MSRPNPNSRGPLQSLAWRFLRLISHRRRAREIARLTLDGYLRDTGWLASLQQLEVVDAAGQPAPWYTLPFVDFLGPRLRPEWRIFEFGAGASTRYFAARVAEVWAVEHDSAFAARLRPLLPANARLMVQPEDSDAYATAAREMPGEIDLISVDGRDRGRCIVASYPRLSPRGVLVLDDAERPQYAPGVTELRRAGFRSVEFWGVSAGTADRKCTTVFYRPGNILDL